MSAAVEQVDVLVVGAGAAGLMCAQVAAARGRRVLVIERANKPGKKILMSGGGRCNFTNTAAGPEHFIASNPHFCKSALARYTPWDFIAMVDRHRIAWHEKTPGQLFCDDSAKLIVRMLLDECARGGAQVRTQCGLEHLAVADDGRFDARTTQGHVSAARVVVASGGLSIPSLGGSGIGYALAQQFGHALVPTRAGLVPLTLSGRHQARLADLSGVALPVVASSAAARFSDAMLITHRGLSGPAILQVSSYWQPGERLEIDLLAGRDAHQMLHDWQRTRPDSELRTLLADVLPRRLAQRLCEHWIDSQPVKRYTPAQLAAIARVLQAWPVVASGTEGYRTAEVTLGGVHTDAVSSSTFESRHVPGLHFIGEVLDVTGWLGGYNFQWAWASGHAAGQAV